MKRRNKEPQNLLEFIPVRNPEITDTEDENGIVTLAIPNKGAFNRIAQVLFRKPKISYVHLDENGSFAWKQIDGKTTILDIGKVVDEHFGEAAHPLYERLGQFFQILHSYNFITWA